MLSLCSLDVRLRGSHGEAQSEQDMSWPHHSGDLILPWSLGHLETWTVEPSSLARVSFTSGAPQAPQVALTDMPQDGHS